MTAAVVLAAGLARRAGGPKAVWPVGGRPSVVRVCQAALDTPGLAPVVVVTGAWADEVRAAVAGLPVTLVHNPEYETGQSSSLRAGLAALPPETEAVVFLMADQPFISPDLLSDMIQCRQKNPGAIIVPVCRGQRYAPVLFDLTRWREDLLGAAGDQGGRGLLAAHPEALAPLNADDRPEMFLDFDRIEEYEELINAAANTH